jgi:alcohol dehydrogenase YqhD (iron-dependent ADH family)
MQNFVFHNPTKIIFGKGTVASIGAEASLHGRKALLLTGGGSVKRSGVFDAIVESLSGHGIEWREFGGIVSNPLISSVRRAIDVIRAHGLDMVIAAGGGSVLDSAKAIAAGAVVDHDPWDFYIRKAQIQRALPVLSVLTLAATGSEMNGSSVMTNDETREKFSFGSLHTYPKVSILDPTTTYSVNPEYSAYGAADAAMHLLEPYFNNSNPVSPLQDGLVESLMRTINGAIEAILRDPDDYNGRAQIMWCSTYALNGMTSAGMGRTVFPVHMIGHSLSALFDTPHGASLSIVFPGWLRYRLDRQPERIAQLGRTVFGVRESDTAKAAVATIDALCAWYVKIGTPFTLSGVGIPESEIPRIAENATGLAQLWNSDEYDAPTIAGILKLCA